MRRALVGLLLSACPIPAFAEAWGVATISSYHSRCPSCYNTNNFGLGGEYSISSNTRIVAGAYDNSQYHTSVYGGLAYTPWRIWKARIGATFGAVTGYREENLNRATPMVVPLIQIEHKDAGMNFGFIPTKHAGLVVGLQLKFKFKE